MFVYRAKYRPLPSKNVVICEKVMHVLDAQITTTAIWQHKIDNALDKPALTKATSHSVSLVILTVDGLGEIWALIVIGNIKKCYTSEYHTPPSTHS
jgi:hypothetical protein